MPRPSKYPEQFRRDTVELVRSSGRSLREIGNELGVNHETLRNWLNATKQAEQAAAGRGRGEEIAPTSAMSCAGYGRRSPNWSWSWRDPAQGGQYFAREMGR